MEVKKEIKKKLLLVIVCFKTAVQTAVRYSYTSLMTFSNHRMMVYILHVLLKTLL